MKSVCIILQSHYEVDLRARRKAEALVSAGYSVDVLALRSAYSPRRDYNVGGVNLYTLSLRKKRGSLSRYAFEYLAFFLWALFKVSYLMNKRHYAVIDVNNLPDFLVFAAVYAKWRSAKIVFDMHEIAPEFFASKYRSNQDSPVVRLLKYVERASFNFADQVITVNQPIEWLLKSRGLPASKSTIITNSVDESFFTSSLNSADSEDAADPTVSRGRFVMMYHGTLTHLYGIDLALQAFGIVRKEMPGAEFWILGDGPEQAPLEELARRLGLESSVRFVGMVLPHEIPRWLQRCDIGVLATRQDIFLDLSLSGKLSEYVVMKKPVISSRLKTIRHYFSEQALGFFDPNSPSDLARQMVSMYRDSSRRGRMAERANEEYTPIRWAVMRDRYLRLMADLAGSNP